MNFLATVLICFFCGASALAGQQIPLDQAVPIILKETPNLIILGEDHKNPSLAIGLNGLLKALRKKQNFNCLFLELSSDIQTQLNESIGQRDLRRFSRSTYNSKNFAYIEAYKRMGVTPEQLETIKSYFVTHQDEPLSNYPFNQETLDFLDQEKISLIAYDVESESHEFLENTYDNLMDEYYPRTPERDVEGMRTANVRSKIMGKNIETQFKLKNCTKAAIVIGYAHLYSSQYFNGLYKSDIDLIPLQDLLAERLLTSVVMIAEHPQTNKNISVVLGADPETRFSRFIGRLLTPQF